MLLVGGALLKVVCLCCISVVMRLEFACGLWAGGCLLCIIAVVLTRVWVTVSML